MCVTEEKSCLYKILFVDDDSNLLFSFVRQFRRSYDIDTALGPIEALHKISEGIEYAVIICDMRMPEMTGIEFFEKIRDVIPHSVKIMLTGNADMETAIESVNRGDVFRFLTKPCDMDNLRFQIEQAISRYNYIKGLEEKSMTDSLTGFFNHNSIIEKLDSEIKRASRYKSHLSIIMFDIDFFKRINDTYGHQVGDKVLVIVSSTLKSMIRETDFPGRYGGEEFLIVLPETDLETALVIGERIRNTIGTLSFDEKGLTVTISGGLKEFIDGDAIELIKNADSLLYLAKKKGRNRIEF